MELIQHSKFTIQNLSHPRLFQITRPDVARHR
jgi:hypothetical protein